MSKSLLKFCSNISNCTRRLSPCSLALPASPNRNWWTTSTFYRSLTIVSSELLSSSRTWMIWNWLNLYSLNSFRPVISSLTPFLNSNLIRPLTSHCRWWGRSWVVTFSQKKRPMPGRPYLITFTKSWPKRIRSPLSPLMIWISSVIPGALLSEIRISAPMLSSSMIFYLEQFQRPL